MHDTVIEDKENVDVPATQRAPVGGWEYEHGYELLQSSEDGVQEGIKYINEVELEVLDVLAFNLH